jgi:hypothetical protein
MRMKNCMLGLVLICAAAASARADVIALWNFNDAVSNSTGGALEFLVDRGAGAMISDFSAANIGNAAGTVINSQGEDTAGLSLRLSGSANNGRDLIWMASTAGYESILVSFAVQGTSTGFDLNQFYYSTNSGGSWQAFGPVFDPPASFGLQSFDLGPILQLNDNPYASFRIIFDGATSGSGNNRLDNLVVSGNPIRILPPPLRAVPEPSTWMLTLAGLAFAGAAQRRGIGRKRLAGNRTREPRGGRG